MPEAHFQSLTTGIVICDRYSAYKKLARTMGFLLAFCWAHVRRDFLTLARGYPEQEAWAMAWVARIGTLYTLNNQRLAYKGRPPGSAGEAVKVWALSDFPHGIGLIIR